ncbi:hypothetical protein PHYBLDRAFT_159183 [Phycomyces blakesleeanus NRRL 1555(-)]|uniref:Uncharacterized protein n=1 Tax=Phycomyces blakesleeanus (strain ATCC 8743b / DSM 1359 / FGSC 10004 / NBRC 33097 / NRRL 1555) TaxID=763407 RepID=A0A162U619_PHYB8|nr:hypothetical protein PHYBLDRAFT_159182 [Phycomyces blakesleeanus NRRL 1555(-)]XP_018290653.1 hypothetical protein PHYBLDRAFT_159183 [Phycomyces blakesleeanus NRRL 1555(-)]OAD72609.1 hypothetical protein PHYBLDRAFT_159182 [Phycomyces blakesleeanus NRRL 1555(-)]OAD72613.1 hypothetical protein PHYBLDRAFT_159183 [Phycomyces blakesleeanus NRRL 1555(-)]|eukprot:XP_018290649.1 hypothetical protein PHYBLDRAFT_159182 [Phycomyces blakesleeanus NRRL 1555(-)]
MIRHAISGYRNKEFILRRVTFINNIFSDDGLGNLMYCAIERSTVLHGILTRNTDKSC